MLVIRSFGPSTGPAAPSGPKVIIPTTLTWGRCCAPCASGAGVVHPVHPVALPPSPLHLGLPKRTIELVELLYECRCFVLGSASSPDEGPPCCICGVVAAATPRCRAAWAGAGAPVAGNGPASAWTDFRAVGACVRRMMRDQDSAGSFHLQALRDPPALQGETAGDHSVSHLLQVLAWARPSRVASSKSLLTATQCWIASTS